jgi:integrase
LLQVVETIDGGDIRHEQVKRHPDIVAEMEKKYMFFAEQADNARRKIKRGQSCVFNVYYREP